MAPGLKSTPPDDHLRQPQERIGGLDRQHGERAPDHAEPHSRRTKQESEGGQGDERNVQQDADRRDQVKPEGDQGHGRQPDDCRGQHALGDAGPDPMQAAPPPRIVLVLQLLERRRCAAEHRFDPRDRRAQPLLSRGYQPDQGTNRQEGELTADIKKKEWVPRQGEQTGQGQRVGRPGGTADDRGHAECQRHDGRTDHGGSKSHKYRVAKRGQCDTAISQATG